MTDPERPDPADEEIHELERRLAESLQDEPIDPVVQAREEMEARVAAAARVELPEPPSEQDLEDRIRKVTGKASLDEAREAALHSTGSEDLSSVYKGTATGLQLAYALLGMPLLGLGLGYFLDDPGGTTWKGVLGALGAVIGIAYVIWRTSACRSDR